MLLRIRTNQTGRLRSGRTDLSLSNFTVTERRSLRDGRSAQPVELHQPRLRRSEGLPPRTAVATTAGLLETTGRMGERKEEPVRAVERMQRYREHRCLSIPFQVFPVFTFTDQNSGNPAASEVKKSPAQPLRFIARVRDEERHQLFGLHQLLQLGDELIAKRRVE